MLQRIVIATRKEQYLLPCCSSAVYITRQLYPYLTLQAFINSESKDILSLAIARTADVIDYVEKGFAEEKHTGYSQVGQAAFYVLHWGDMQRKGYKVLVYLN